MYIYLFSYISIIHHISFLYLSFSSDHFAYILTVQVQQNRIMLIYFFAESITPFSDKKIGSGCSSPLTHFLYPLEHLPFLFHKDVLLI